MAFEGRLRLYSGSKIHPEEIPPTDRKIQEQFGAFAGQRKVAPRVIPERFS